MSRQTHAKAPLREPPAAGDGHAARQAWMGMLARAHLADLEGAFAVLPERPHYRVLRAPETGLVMVRGRAGGSGAAFNMGEMTVTRCSVETEGGHVGHGYVAGRAVRHAELAAVFDALFQHPAQGDALRKDVLARLGSAEDSRQRTRAAETATTRVDFFTLVRGEDDPS